MTNGKRAGVGLPIAGAVLLAAATPPAVLPGAELLVVPGLMAWFAVACDTRRPLWHGYVLGCVHMAWFSWSVHHLMWFAYTMIVVLGGVYYAIANAAVRAASRRAQLLAFAIAVAGSFWLRAVMPEIYYPHGQPCHSLWQWPLLLNGVVVGGEPLVNALLAALAAALVDLWRSWRVAVPAWRAAVRNAAIAGCLFTAVTVIGESLAPDAGTERPVTVAAIEPGVHIAHELMPLPTRERQRARGLQLLEERLIAPTRELLRGATPPDVVLWPESSLPDTFDARDFGTRPFSRLGTWPRSKACLVLGGSVAVEAGEKLPPTPAALRFELAGGRLVDHQQKRVLVPGGEFPPLYSWLPRSVGDTLVAWFEAALGDLPHATPGKELPPLQPEGGVPFGALMCYDNAFPGPAAAQVAMGARWLCVLSNESWYEGGGELVQLTAMAVVRALETCTPIVRCTQDGWSCLVDARGRVVASLPIAPAPQPAARILRVAITPGPGRLPPLAWLRSATGPAAGLALLALLLHALLRRARLLPVRTAVHAATDAGSSGIARGSGS